MLIGKKIKINKFVISASRRTDIPAFYMEWFMDQIEKGFFSVVNPYNNRISIIPVNKDTVHTIVFWSKDFSQFIKGKYGQKILKKGFNLFFNFTINSISKILEPNITPLYNRLEQLDYICNNFNPKSVQWRFDPICYYQYKTKFVNNLDDFIKIANKACQSSVERCVTSFMDDYPKIKKRIIDKDFTFVELPLEEKIDTVINMQKILTQNSINLYVCCEKELLNNLPDNSKIYKSSCIPNDYLIQLYGGNLPLNKDKGQRISSGCGCKVSIDIGDYKLHPCQHNCLYCYANPVQLK